jgi:hypothetical protein
MTWRENLVATCGDRQLVEIVLRALDTLLNRDEHLLQANVSERAISHRLGVYLDSSCRIGTSTANTIEMVTSQKRYSATHQMPTGRMNMAAVYTRMS